MSGIEVAGIVLGALPLFISVAAHYRDGLGSIGRFFKKERILNIYIHDLETHVALLRLHLERVIGNTSLPAKIQQELVDQPNSPLWHRQDVQIQLRQSLGSTAEMFQSIMKRMADIFLEQLKLNNYQNLRQIILDSEKSKASWLKSFAQRVEFSWKSPQRNEVLIQLKTCNEDLSKLISAVEEAKPYQKKQQVRKVHAAWQSRIQSQQLFDALTSICTCSCQPGHRAKLRIKPYTDDDEDVDYACILFDVSFQRTLDCERKVAVKIYRTSILNDKKSAVKIAVAGRSNAPDKAGWKAVSDICSAVEAANNVNLHLALAIDEKKDLWETEKLPTSLSNAANPNLSLEALLPIFVQYNNKRWLAREKLILAVISAYSILQLHDSSWLPQGLSSNQIYFLKHYTRFDSTLAAKVGNILGRPYVSSDFQSTPGSTSIVSNTHRNLNLLSLGIMLLELHLNEPVQSSNTDLAVLRLKSMDLLQEHYDDLSMSSCYYEAVRFCLFPKPDPSTRLIEFSDQAFREMYYRNVILPLEEELHQNYEISQQFWDSL